MLEGLGADTRLVRWPSELERLDGLVIPGGESTAIAKLLAIHGMYGPLRAAHAGGMAVFGTCAGAILMARDIEGARLDQEPLALMDVRIRRNAYGRQIDSFETTVPWAGIEGDPVKGVFIRAPRFAARSAPGRAIFSPFHHGAERCPLFSAKGNTIMMIRQKEDAGHLRYPSRVCNGPEVKWDMGQQGHSTLCG